jgi:hypothetical protein
MSLISKIRVANTLRTAEAEVRPSSFADVVTWQRRIHAPFIAPTQGIGSDWDWPALYLGCHFSEQTFGRQALAFQIRVADPAGGAVPVAQAILSLPYAWPGGEPHKCVFLWFIAAAPAAALNAYGITEKFSVLPPVLDVAVQVSRSHGLEGRIGLHAAAGRTPNETNDLVRRYAGHGLRRRSRLRGFFRFPHRPEDGRLFYFTPEDALAFSAKQDDLR